MMAIIKIKKKRNGLSMELMKSGSSDSNDKKRIVKVVLALALAVIAVILGDCAAILFSKNFDDMSGIVSVANILSFSVRSIIGAVGLICLGGKSWLVFNKDSFKKSFKTTLPLVIINVVLGIGLVILGLAVSYSNGGTGPSSDYLLRLALSFVLMLLVGINEELIFRGLALGGFLLWFGKKKNGVLIASIISSIIFGYIHVMVEIDFTTMLSVITGLLKTLETAMFGFIFCRAILENKNYWGAIIAHAIFDWVLIAGTLLISSDFELSYVSQDSKTAISQCVYFVIIVLLYLPFTIKAVKAIRSMQPTDGFFGE